MLKGSVDKGHYHHRIAALSYTEYLQKALPDFKVMHKHTGRRPDPIKWCKHDVTRSKTSFENSQQEIEPRSQYLTIYVSLEASGN